MRIFIPCLVIAVFQIAHGIDLKYSSTHLSWTFIGSGSSYRVNSFTYKDRNITVSTVNGLTDPIIGPNDIQGLKFESCVTYFVPNGIEKFFTNLVGLNFYNSQLKSLEKSDLKPFGKLEELILSYNNLEILDSDVFDYNPNLIFVNFDYNELKFIGIEILDSLNVLKYAYFQQNVCLNTYSHSRSSHSSLKSTFESKCSLSTVVQEKVCRDDVNRFEETVQELTGQLEAAELKIKRLEALLASCDGNLNSAIGNMILTSEYLDSCIGENKEFTAVDRTMDKTVEFMCSFEDDDKSTCVANNLEINVMHSAIDKVSYEGPETDTSIITALKINVQRTLFLPLGLALHFKLDTLEVTESGLYEIDRIIFANMTKLTTLNLSKNKLQKVAADTFEDLVSLQKLDLSSNFIRKLKSGQFRNLVNLEQLNLRDNLLSTIEVEILENLSSLKKLFLQENELKFVSANLLTPLTKLEMVDLTNNTCIDLSFPSTSLKELEAQIIDNCIAPIELDCANDSNLTSYVDESDKLVCSAKSLKVDYPKTKIKNILLVDNDKSVTVFAAVNQSTKFLPYQLGSTLPNVTTIIVENSKLTTLQKHDFAGFVSLKTIIIRHNNLTKIEEQTFDDAVQVETLDLSYNNIRSLPPKVFLHLIRLKNLILSNNMIESFTADLLPRKNAIEEFWVNSNELEIIETKTLRFLRKAKIIDLTGNICIDLKFDKNDPGSKTLVELSGEIDLNCSADDL